MSDQTLANEEESTRNPDTAETRNWPPTLGVMFLFTALGSILLLLRLFYLDAGATAPLPTLLDLSRLPEGIRHTLVLILFLPLGGLITTTFRQLFGITTFGYFTASLIAISFVYVHWMTSLIVFTVIIVIGGISRLAVGQLRLLKLPRLSLALLVVVLSLTVAVAVIYDLGGEPRGILVPIIALTIMIERFHLNLSARGRGFALKKLAGTLAVAFFCMLLFRIPVLQDWVLRYPECQLFVASGLVFFTRPETNGVDTVYSEDDLDSSGSASAKKPGNLPASGDKP